MNSINRRSFLKLAGASAAMAAAPAFVRAGTLSSAGRIVVVRRRFRRCDRCEIPALMEQLPARSDPDR